MNMTGEQEKKKLLPEGWREFRIMDCVEQISKQGNEMFKFILRDIETQQDDEVYAIAVQGKRWFLKQILTACGIAAGQDGIYEWDIPDVLDKVITGYVSHQEEEWINREGTTVKTTKHKITEVSVKTPF
jgi:hypothetical protein